MFCGPQICQKCVSGRGSASDPTGGAHDALPDSLVGWAGGHPLPNPNPPRRLRRSASVPPQCKILATPLATNHYSAHHSVVYDRCRYAGITCSSWGARCTDTSKYCTCLLVSCVLGRADVQNFYKQYRLYRDSLKDSPRPIRIVQQLDHLRKLAHGKNFKCVHVSMLNSSQTAGRGRGNKDPEFYWSATESD